MMRRGREETPARRALLLFGAAALLVLLAPAADAACRTHPALVAACFRVHGRAALYNGNPTVRIWKLGTHRLLGVSDRRCQPPECEPLPDALRALLAWDHPVFGEFELCPFTRARPGVMQLVCVAAAARLRRSDR